MSTTGATVQTTNTVSLADEEEVKQVLLKSVLGLWDIVNDPQGTVMSRNGAKRDDHFIASIVFQSKCLIYLLFF
jgi:hypothetical protein